MKTPEPKFLLAAAALVALLAALILFARPDEGEDGPAAANALTRIALTAEGMALSGTSSPGTVVTLQRGKDVLASVNVIYSSHWSLHVDAPKEWPFLLSLQWRDAGEAAAVPYEQHLICLKTEAVPTCFIHDRGHGLRGVRGNAKQAERPVIDFIHVAGGKVRDVFGRAPLGRWVQFYVEGQLAGAAAVDREGYWHIAPALDAWEKGKEARIDLLDDGAKLVMRDHFGLRLAPPKGVKVMMPPRITGGITGDRGNYAVHFTDGTAAHVLEAMQGLKYYEGATEKLLPGQMLPDVGTLGATGAHRPAARMAAPVDRM
ncbi:MAG: hypothetical protein GC131_00250 [Alphaproteobacteria bacterium]|nr:hypothetical protein [Alphaproteobacteria bacterium]